MARKRKNAETTGPDWFLPEWMGSLRVTQADLCRETGWSKATMSEIFNGGTNYYRAIVNELARALNIQPYELLMHPDDAFAVRRFRESALTLAAEKRLEFHGAEPEVERLQPRRKAG